MENKNLWKVPMVFAVFFFMVIILSIYLDITFLHSGLWHQVYWNAFKAYGSGTVNMREWNGVTGISVYGQYVGGLIVWSVVSVIAAAAFLAAAIHMKRKYK